MLLFNTLITLNTITSVVWADVKRISSVYKDLGQVQKIYLHAGLISVVEFPQSIIEVRLGNPKSIKAHISSVSTKELTLYLNQQSVEPTNLIVKSDKRVYVFDVIPSRGSHQDYIKISGSYGTPELSEARSPVSIQVLAPGPHAKPQGRLIHSAKLGGD